MNLGTKSEARPTKQMMFVLMVCGFLLQPTAIKPEKSYVAQATQMEAPQCRVEDVETLIAQLLPNLPSYTNRISQRNRRRNRVDGYSYMLVAGRAEFAPLTLGPGEYLSQEPLPNNSQQPQQVFMTTLERRYIDGKPVELQQYHWLFLTRSNNVWRLAMMFSRTGGYPAQQPPTRPRDSSNGIIAQAIRLWLRDCQTQRRSPVSYRPIAPITTPESQLLPSKFVLDSHVFVS